MKSTNKEFFDSISCFYDDMISFDKALIRRTGVYAKLLNPAIRHAADLGCGTGLDSISLAKNGLIVTAFDTSPLMIETAKENASKNKCKIDFVCCSIDKISKKYYGKYDIAVSMGNTLANLPLLKLRAAVKTSYSLLKEKGKIIFQVLNFEKIVKENKRIINISSIPGEYVIRFYDIFPRYLDFNILKFSKENTSVRDIRTTRLYSYNRKIFKTILKAAGYRKIRFYGSLSLVKFISAKSGDLIITAEK